MAAITDTNGAVGIGGDAATDAAAQSTDVLPTHTAILCEKEEVFIY